MSSFTEYTVIYRLTSEQEEKIKRLIQMRPEKYPEETPRSLEEQFSFMMQLESRHDIDEKIEFWEFLYRDKSSDESDGGRQ